MPIAGSPNPHPASLPAPARRRWTAPATEAARRLRGSTAWAGYAAFAWALAYGVGVRGYQGLGGTVGLAGTFEDPAGMRRASLVAGLGIVLAGFGALALVRPWGLRLPRPLVTVPALTGSAYAMAHALTAIRPRSSCGICSSTSPGSWAPACSSRSPPCTTTVAPAGRPGRHGGW